MNKNVEKNMQGYPVKSAAAACDASGESNQRKIKGTRDNFKIHVNFMKFTFLCRLQQDEAYDKK